MKKLFSRLLVPMILLAMLGTLFTVYAMNTTLSDKCPGCESVADVDQNGVVDADDALLVLYYGYFPERYTLPGCPNHGNDTLVPPVTDLPPTTAPSNTVPDVTVDTPPAPPEATTPSNMPPDTTTDDGPSMTASPQPTTNPYPIPTATRPTTTSSKPSPGSGSN